MESASFLPSCTNGMECELLGSLCEVTDLHRVMEVAKARPQKLRKRSQFLEDFVCELQSKKTRSPAPVCVASFGAQQRGNCRRKSPAVTCFLWQQLKAMVRVALEIALDRNYKKVLWWPDFWHGDPVH